MSINIQSPSWHDGFLVGTRFVPDCEVWSGDSWQLHFDILHIVYVWCHLSSVDFLFISFPGIIEENVIGFLLSEPFLF